MFRFLKEMFNTDPDRFIAIDDAPAFSDAVRITLLSASGENEIWNFPGLKRIGIGKTVDLIRDRYYDEYDNLRGHTFCFKVDSWRDGNEKCYLDVGEMVENKIHYPAIRCCYYRPNPTGMYYPDQFICLVYSYSEIEPGIIRAIDRSVKVELQIEKSKS